MSAVSATLVAFVVAATFGWCMLAAGGAAYSAFLQTGAHALGQLTNDLLATNTDPGIATGLGVGISDLPLANAIGRSWSIATEVLIAIGLAIIVWRRKALRISTHFLLLPLASFALMLIAVALPVIAAAMDVSRLYGIALLFLAPCCILGIEGVVDAISTRIHANKDLKLKLKYAALIGVLIPYFLFSYGTIYEIVEHESNYIFLPSQIQSQQVVEYSLSGHDWSYLVIGPAPTESVCASAWLGTFMGRSPIYVDNWAAPQVEGYGHLSLGSLRTLTADNVNQSHANAYVYLTAANVQNGTIALRLSNAQTEEHQISSYPAITAGNRVYSNGLADIYHSAS